MNILFNPHQWTGFLSRQTILMARSSRVTPSTAVASLTQTQKTIPLLAPPPPQPELSPPFKKLQTIATQMEGCERCPLCQTRKKIVMGEGNPHAELVLIGEAPGEQEDIQGRPFVGRAGHLLDRMLQAIALNRSDVYILNVIKCRPPYNRVPEKNEIMTCLPFLHQQIRAIRPKVILTLGKIASQALLQTEEKISNLRGNFYPYQGSQLLPTFHPAYLLRNPVAKKEAWMDLQKVAHFLGITIPQKK